MRSIFTTAVVAAMTVVAPSLAFAAGDAAKGEKVFNRCKACHMVGAKAKNRVGPVLNGVVGRKAGTAEKYRYSKLNQAAGEAGLVWTEENLMAYLPNASAFLKEFIEKNGGKASGRSKMVFALKKEDDRANVIAYLKQFNEAGEKVAATTN